VGSAAPQSCCFAPSTLSNEHAQTKCKCSVPSLSYRRRNSKQLKLLRSLHRSLADSLCMVAMAVCCMYICCGTPFGINSDPHKQTCFSYSSKLCFVNKMLLLFEDFATTYCNMIRRATISRAKNGYPCSGFVTTAIS
jgi:hypothetical protein